MTTTRSIILLLAGKTMVRGFALGEALHPCRDMIQYRWCFTGIPEPKATTTDTRLAPPRGGDRKSGSVSPFVFSEPVALLRRVRCCRAGLSGSALVIELAGNYKMVWCRMRRAQVGPFVAAEVVQDPQTSWVLNLIVQQLMKTQYFIRLHKILAQRKISVGIIATAVEDGQLGGQLTDSWWFRPFFDSGHA